VIAPLFDFGRKMTELDKDLFEDILMFFDRNLLSVGRGLLGRTARKSAKLRGRRAPVIHKQC